MPRRRVGTDEGRAAVDRWARGLADRDLLATAVRFTLEELAARAPGGSVEVRVPPFGAAQCVAGTHHSRGTPPNVVETDPETWLALATGRRAWDDAVAAGVVRASGSRSSLAEWLPLVVDGAHPPGATAPGS